MQATDRAVRAAPPGAPVPLLVVQVGHHRCALPVACVAEIHPAVELVPLPDGPEVVLGLLNRRGRPLPVLGLRHRMGVPRRPTRLDDRLVVVRLPDRDLAVQVDEVVDVLELPVETIHLATAATATAVLGNGVAVLPDGLLVVLDVGAFLTPGDRAQLDRALELAGVTAAG